MSYNKESMCLKYTIEQHHPTLLRCKETGEVVTLEWIVELVNNVQKNNNSNRKGSKRKK